VKKADKVRETGISAGSGNYRLPRRDIEKEALLVGLKKGVRGGGNRRGKVLVMDDEDVIRSILSVMLLAFGYEAHLTADGREAIDSYAKAAEAGEPFDAVIIDLNIPGGMGGGETMQRLRQIDPDVKAIVSSGYEMENYREQGFRAVLSKPYTVSGLRNVLNEVTFGESAVPRPRLEGDVETEKNLRA
jgi:CheY-like chemotaxis protein